MVEETQLIAEHAINLKARLEMAKYLFNNAIEDGQDIQESATKYLQPVRDEVESRILQFGKGDREFYEIASNIRLLIKDAERPGRVYTLATTTRFYEIIEELRLRPETHVEVLIDEKGVFIGRLQKDDAISWYLQKQNALVSQKVDEYIEEAKQLIHVGKPYLADQIIKQARALKPAETKRRQLDSYYQRKIRPLLDRIERARFKLKSILHIEDIEEAQTQYKEALDPEEGWPEFEDDPGIITSAKRHIIGLMARKLNQILDLLKDPHSLPLIRSLKIDELEKLESYMRWGSGELQEKYRDYMKLRAIWASFSDLPPTPTITSITSIEESIEASPDVDDTLVDELYEPLSPSPDDDVLAPESDEAIAEPIEPPVIASLEETTVFDTAGAATLDEPFGVATISTDGDSTEMDEAVAEPFEPPIISIPEDILALDPGSMPDDDYGFDGSRIRGGGHVFMPSSTVKIDLKGSSHIFMSYAHKNYPIMDRVRNTLSASGFRIWTDEEILPGTPRFPRIIEEKIKTAVCLIVIWTPDADDSDWVPEELGYALQFKKPILPILALGDVIGLGLTLFQRVDIREADAYDREMQRLIRGIRNYLSML